jgi:hypothetical protein
VRGAFHDIRALAKRPAIAMAGEVERRRLDGTCSRASSQLRKNGEARGESRYVGLNRSRRVTGGPSAASKRFKILFSGEM